MRISRFVLAACALGAIGLGYFVYRTFSDTSDSAQQSEKAIASIRDSSKKNNESIVSKPAQTTAIASVNSQMPSKNARLFSASSLPAEQLPLVKSYEALKRSADEGNPFAACRLAADVYQCGVYRFLNSRLNDLKKMLAELDPASAQAITLSNEVKYLDIDVKRYTSVCEGFLNKDNIEPWKYLLQAALAGNVQAKAGFVFAPPVNTNGPFANIEFAEAYRANAPSLLIDAATAGSRKAVEGAAWGYLGTDGSSVFQPGLGLQLLPRDPYKAAYYFYASAAFPVVEQSHINRREDLRRRVEGVTTPEQREKVKTEANALVASWQLGRTDWLTRTEEREKKGESFYGHQCED